MIVNSIGDSNQMMDSQSLQNENYFLKRKLTLDMLDPNQSYVQPKKRFIQNFSNSFLDQCNDNFHLNGTAFNTECNGIELISFDGVTLVPPIPIHTTTVFSSAINSDNFDATWGGADLLELDQRYNSVVNLNDSCQEPVKIPSEVELDEPKRTNNANLESASQEQNDIDFDDRNLSWLFNFKLDELPHLSPEVNRTGQLSPTNKRPQHHDDNLTQQIRTGRKVDELITEITADFDDNEMTVAENVTVENTPKMPKKPPFTYTELIEYALEDKGELTVSGIYQWISDRFPFYKSNDDRWKNSVRHNLSINPHFRKGVKAAQGAGHLWTISSQNSEEHNLAWQHKKQRLELFFKLEQSNQRKNSTSPEKDPSQFDETAIAVANLTQHILQPNTPEAVVEAPNDTPIPLVINEQNNDLERTAGEILNGVHRNVEVQAVHSTIITYQDSLLEGDYLSSNLDKDHLIPEHTLRINNHHHHNDIDSAYYVTEIDPVELGINMTNVEEEVMFNDEFNLNYFGLASGNDIVA